LAECARHHAARFNDGREANPLAFAMPQVLFAVRFAAVRHCRLMSSRDQTVERGETTSIDASIGGFKVKDPK
jgi:hypothetical protein